MNSSSIEIVSFCTKEHLAVWKLCSRLLLENVKADHYVVYVPEEQVDTFLAETPRGIVVRSENSLAPRFAAPLRKKVLGAENLERFGWYFQQYLKLTALENTSADLVIIWDSDSVPVREISFLGIDGRLLYLTSDEFHPPYFDMIRRLTGFDRSQLGSFIGPGFPVRKVWFEEFVAGVSEKWGVRDWVEALMEVTDFSLESGFSEYEMLGTWISQVHGDQIVTRPARWERFGTSRFGCAERQTQSGLISAGELEGLEVISFENWDRNLRARLRRYWHHFRNLTRPKARGDFWKERA